VLFIRERRCLRPKRAIEALPVREIAAGVAFGDVDDPREIRTSRRRHPLLNDPLGTTDRPIRLGEQHRRLQRLLRGGVREAEIGLRDETAADFREGDRLRRIGEGTSETVRGESGLPEEPRAQRERGITVPDAAGERQLHAVEGRHRMPTAPQSEAGSMVPALRRRGASDERKAEQVGTQGDVGGQGELFRRVARRRERGPVEVNDAIGDGDGNETACKQPNLHQPLVER
jgi:hypothetical protein